MKAIKERAKKYARKVWRGGTREYGSHMKLTECDFIAGAQSEREELTRWRNPNEELPENNSCVLMKVIRMLPPVQFLRATCDLASVVRRIDSPPAGVANCRGFLGHDRKQRAAPSVSDSLSGNGVAVDRTTAAQSHCREKIAHRDEPLFLRCRSSAGGQGAYQNKRAQGADCKSFHQFSPSLFKTFAVLSQFFMKSAASSSTLAPVGRRSASTGFFEASTFSRPL